MAEPRWKVLIVDDNRSAAMALATLVSDLGFVLTLAESGEQALKVAWELRPCLLAWLTAFDSDRGAAEA